AAAEDDRSRLFLVGDSNHLEEPPHRLREVEDQGNGHALPVRRVVRLAREVLQPGRLSKSVVRRRTALATTFDDAVVGVLPDGLDVRVASNVAIFGDERGLILTS